MIGVSNSEFWKMTPIEFWNAYTEYVDRHNGGKAPRAPMTVEQGKTLRSKIAAILKGKGKAF